MITLKCSCDVTHVETGEAWHFEFEQFVSSHQGELAVRQGVRKDVMRRVVWEMLRNIPADGGTFRFGKVIVDAKPEQATWDRNLGMMHTDLKVIPR